MSKTLTTIILTLGIFASFTPMAMARLVLPDVGSSSLLLGVSLAGIAVARMFWSKKK